MSKRNILIPLRAMALLSVSELVSVSGLYKSVVRVCQKLKLLLEKICETGYLPGLALQTSFQSRIKDLITSLPKADFDHLSSYRVSIFIINIRWTLPRGWCWFRSELGTICGNNRKFRLANFAFRERWMVQECASRTGDRCSRLGMG